MRSCVLLVLLLGATAACETAKPPPEPPAAPLVIGTSPAGPAATVSAEAAVPDDPVVVSGGLAVPARDLRILHGTSRPRPPLTTELQSLEALLAATASNAPDRPILVRKLADTYGELGRVTGGAVATNAHRMAAKYYDLLVAESAQSQLDEAYYYAGLEHELAGNPSGARRSYYELIKRSPSSRLIPFAYFAFGEIFLAEADADPSKDQLAEQAYREVLKYPPARNALYVEAQRRLAEIGMRRKAGGSTRP
jgi:hypothetical protein